MWIRQNKSDLNNFKCGKLRIKSHISIYLTIRDIRDYLFYFKDKEVKPQAMYGTFSKKIFLTNTNYLTRESQEGSYS